MDEDQAWWLLMMVVAAFVLGLVVYLVNDDYRFKEIIESNNNYYSHVDVDVP